MSNLNFGIFGQTNNLFRSNAKFITVPTTAWKATNWDKDVDIHETRVIARADNATLVAPVYLPDGVTVTSYILYGSNGAKEYSMYQSQITNGTTVGMGQTNLNSAITTVSNAVIDNSKYYYSIKAIDVDTNEEIYGAQVFFTETRED